MYVMNDRIIKDEEVLFSMDKKGRRVYGKAKELRTMSYVKAFG